ncbi:unnamed protein product [Phytomonas sp. EM1]|nr:unnamed protein product [Phytomonas sp. EM1]|eukprot:CCW62272.1 unnamed protein product [Phytomonas sp. isolate EM1]
MGKFFAEFQKLNELIRIIIALSPKYVGTKKFFEIMRIVFNILFIICDNLALMANFNLLAVNRVAMSTRAKKCQTLGYLFAAVVDLFNLKDAIWRLNYDPPAAKYAICSSALLFVQNSTDAFTNMLFLGYLNFIFAPTDVSIGNLTCIAAMMGLVSHWRKMK